MDKLQNNKKTVFTVPEGYFEQLNKEIIGATAGSRPASPRHKSHIIGKFSRLTGYAAAVALLLFVAKNILTPDNDTDNNISLAENITESEYIDNILNSYTIDDYTFYCYLTDSDFE